VMKFEQKAPGADFRGHNPSQERATLDRKLPKWLLFLQYQ
jgi:hypothetical protein